MDVMDSIIEQLQKNTSYTVTEIGAEGTKVNTITNYRAINSKYQEAEVVKEIASADLVSTLLSLRIPCTELLDVEDDGKPLTSTGYLRSWPQHPEIHCPCHCQSHRRPHRK